MEKKSGNRKIFNWIVSAIAILFGIMTIKSGGQVLFGDESYRVAAGNYVPFVLWFNFMSGFVYVVTGIGILLHKSWSMLLAMLIAGASLLVFVALGVHVFTDGAYETRTVAAMTLRSTVWVAISVFLFWNMKKGADHVA